MRDLAPEWPVRAAALRAGMILAALLAGSAGCALKPPPSTTGLEMHSLRMVLEPEPSGKLPFSDHGALVGGIELSPLLDREGVDPSAAAGLSFQVLAHYGRLYLTAERFHAVWELTPVPGESLARIRPIPIAGDGTGGGMKAPTLSRFGGDGTVCVRVDQQGHDPVFIDSQGNAGATCS